MKLQTEIFCQHKHGVASFKYFGSPSQQQQQPGSAGQLCCPLNGGQGWIFGQACGGYGIIGTFESKYFSKNIEVLASFYI